jgi:hypothetical protein
MSGRSEVRTQLTGTMVEPPRWHEGWLSLSDWSAQEILAVDLAGSRKVVVRTCRGGGHPLGSGDAPGVPSREAAPVA